MLDVAWPELMVVGAVALVVIGPKDLPKVMHTIGVWVGKARRVFLSVQHDFDRLAREAEEAERTAKAPEANLNKEPDREG